MWDESKHPRDELGQFTEKEKAGKLLGTNIGTHVNTKKTGMSYYDNFLNEEDADYMRRSKNLKGDIQMLSPQEYYEMCADKIFENTSVDSLKEQRKTDQDNSHLIDVLKRGDALDMPMINLANKGQEGLHRMMVLGDMYGWDEKQPVLVVDWDDKQYEIDRRNNEIDYGIEMLEDDIKETRVYNKESFINRLKRNLNYNFNVKDLGDKVMISDDMVQKTIPIPKFDDEEEDLTDLDDLLDYEDLL